MLVAIALRPSHIIVSQALMACTVLNIRPEENAFRAPSILPLSLHLHKVEVV